ncbi:Lactose transport system permease protein LacF [compost metagenome]
MSPEIGGENSNMHFMFDAASDDGADLIQRPAEESGHGGEQSTGFGGEKIDDRTLDIRQGMAHAAALIGIMRRKLPAAFLTDQHDAIDDQRQKAACALDQFAEHEIVQHPPTGEIQRLEIRPVAGNRELPVVLGPDHRPAATGCRFGILEHMRLQFIGDAPPCISIIKSSTGEKLWENRRDARCSLAKHHFLLPSKPRETSPIICILAFLQNSYYPFRSCLTNVVDMICQSWEEARKADQFFAVHLRIGSRRSVVCGIFSRRSMMANSTIAAGDTPIVTRRRKVVSRRRRRVQDALVAYSFIAPNFLGFAVFTLGPILFAFVLAFMHWDGSNAMTFAGLDNFWRLFEDKAFIAAFWNTIIYTVVSVPATLACALGLAILLNQKILGRDFFRTAMFFPYVASLVAVAVVWNMIFNPEMGPVNMLLYTLGLDPKDMPGWAADRHWAMVTVILFGVWKSMGYFMVIYLAGLQGINSELYEAADLDGANAWQKFLYVTVPQLGPTTFFVTVMLTIQSFKVFDQIYMITQGGPGTSTLVLVYHIYNEAFVSWDLGYSSMIALVLFFLVLGITVIQFRRQKED